ncbi:low molecular weight protein-tyrosine-phosphatase [Eilatimonas milleporae]|uniref:protein-tyrosine-phosphatase n=1 Tax=Eilatimonas milleporae TaxID=911205 RepID=A0A3M0C1K8_9PROT|nr:low molecular weight protein-tyrosine-phosphatase [Eilatimonas milleporae]RMB02755.1 protein-tyrosine phosphatase [Eilatimonas milleporae]
MIAVLFVCMGNICRSPMAEGAFRAAAGTAGLADRLTIDSAGTIGYHAGKAPDTRAQAAARKRNVDISVQRARKVEAGDFSRFDYILAMDGENLEDLLDACPPPERHKISLFLSHAPHLPVKDMPDPYHGHERDFELCYRAAMDAADGLLTMIRERHFNEESTAHKREP